MKVTKNATKANPSHGIVVCFKNEEDNLTPLLQQLLGQSCDSIILVDDYSTDTSLEVLEAVASEKIKIVKPSIDRPGKKAALLEGTRAAHTDSVVYTDADCRPATTDWSQIMVGHLGGARAVLGYAPMTKHHGWLATFSRYETYLTGIQYLSYAQAGIPYMGVGRNMAVQSSAAIPILKEMQGDNIASGDDDLLIQGLAKKGWISTCIDQRTFVYSIAPDSMGKYIRQKSRHMSTASSYRFFHQVLLAVFAGTHIMTYALICVLLIFWAVGPVQVLLILAVKWMLQMIVNAKLMKLLDEKGLWWKFPILDIATFVFYVVLTPYLLFKNKTKWS